MCRVYLVLASLIAPAVATRSVGITAGAGVRGVASPAVTRSGPAVMPSAWILSALYDLPSGAAIVCAMCALALAANFARQPGGRKYAARRANSLQE